MLYVFQKHLCNKWKGKSWSIIAFKQPVCSTNYQILCFSTYYSFLLVDFSWFFLSRFLSLLFCLASKIYFPFCVPHWFSHVGYSILSPYRSSSYVLYASLFLESLCVFRSFWFDILHRFLSSSFVPFIFPQLSFPLVVSSSFSPVKYCLLVLSRRYCLYVPCSFILSLSFNFILPRSIISHSLLILSI